MKSKKANPACSFGNCPGFSLVRPQAKARFRQENTLTAAPAPMHGVLTIRRPVRTDKPAQRPGALSERINKTHISFIRDASRTRKCSQVVAAGP